MMSLQTFDQAYSSNLTTGTTLSPLLVNEALRRTTWSTFYLDTITDGGRYGFHTVDETAFRLQLPCDNTLFLRNEQVSTKPLFFESQVPPNATNEANLDMSAYLLRTVAIRRRLLHFAFRASYREHSVERLSTELLGLEEYAESGIMNLPSRFHCTPENLFLYHDRLTTFILLHVLRHNIFIILGRAALQIYLRDPGSSDQVQRWRQKRIQHARPIATLLSEGSKANISFDPQLGVQAYVALESEPCFSSHPLGIISPDPKSFQFSYSSRIACHGRTQRSIQNHPT